MQVNRRLVVAIAIVFALLFALARTGFLRYWGQASKPLGEGSRVEFPSFPSARISQAERQQFLVGDFAIVRDLKALPRPVVEVFTEKGGSRLLMANPGQAFEVSDVIADSSMPRERLIFAGVLNDKCFVHYEKGGYAHTYILEFFSLPSTGDLKPLWQGYCTSPAANLQDLRSALMNGKCG